MRIQPRQQVFDIWRAVINGSIQGDEWVWGGRDGSNSISDAEQLLCLLYPATEITGLALDRPDATASDILNVLRVFGDSQHIPWRIIQLLNDYITRHTDADGEPIFTGGSYLRTANGGSDGKDLRPPTPEQQELDVLDAYSMSLTLCLATLGFISVYRHHVARRPKLRKMLDDVQAGVEKRLTAALVGLHRSFVVNWFKPTDGAGRIVLGMVNQADEPESAVKANLVERLIRVRNRLRDIGVSAPVESEPGDEPELFECGWSWGIAEGAAPVEFVRSKIANRKGIADNRPYLYFTVVALDGINDLLSPRTRELNLLNTEQRRLAEGLQTRAELTQRYWSTIARFTPGHWPLEDIPWRTTDGKESDYYSLLVSAVLVQDLQSREATDDDLTRAVTVFEELARRGRITQRVMANDPARGLHVPGLSMKLTGTDRLGPQLYWRVADFAPLLMKRSLQAATLSANVTSKDRLMSIAGKSMEHLMRRRLRRGASAGLWDDPQAVFPPDMPDGAAPAVIGSDGAEAALDDTASDRPSWYLTERVVEALVATARTYLASPLRSNLMAERVIDLLNEADHLLNQEMLTADAEDQSEMSIEITKIESRLERARTLLSELPSTAYVLAGDALLRLDELAVARINATRSM